MIALQTYDGSGNLKTDAQSDLMRVEWTPYGKVRELEKSNDNFQFFGYDALQNRVYKERNKNGTLKEATYYIRDAQGNTLAVYNQTENGSLTWQEQYLYGSTRIGVFEPNTLITSDDTPVFLDSLKLLEGNRRFELSNHLGNVLATINDRRRGVDNNLDNLVDYYETVVINAQDYYPFGMEMLERSYSLSGSAYRFGFNGKEADRDGEFGSGTNYDFGERNYDPRIGRFRSIDAFATAFPAHSPYAYALNNPVYLVDEDGTYPKPSKILASFGLELPPLAAGIIDGAADASPLGMIGFAYDLTTDAQFRSDMYDAFTAIATDPVGALGTMLSEYKGTIERVMAGEATDEDMYMLGEEVGGLITGIITGGSIAKYTKKLLDSRSKANGKNSSIKDPCGCFTAGTKVKTSNGEKNIEHIIVGDWVWAYDDSTQNIALKQVIYLHEYERDTIYKVFIGEEIIEATSDHPFFVEEEYLEARFLKKGHSLKLLTGESILIDSIQVFEGIYKVYNFTVENYHTYFVGSDGILVHNDPCDVDKRAKEISEQVGNKRIVIGVGENSKGEVFVATNEDYVRGDVLKVLKPEEIPVNGKGHAENTLVEKTDINKVGSSIDVCIECEITARKNNVEIKSPLLNDFSRKRKRELSPEQQQQKRAEVEKLRNKGGG